MTTLTNTSPAGAASSPEIPGEVIPGKVTNAQLGMLVAIASFAMLFGTMLLSYLLIRARQTVWPPIGVEPLDKQISTIATLVLLGSSVFIHHAIKALQASKFDLFKRYWAIGTWAGFAFLALQTVFVAQMWQQGLRVQDGLFASISYMLVIFHAIHVVFAWGWMLTVNLRSIIGSGGAGAYKTPTAQNPVLASWMWHFLDVVWILTCLLIVWY